MYLCAKCGNTKKCTKVLDIVQKSVYNTLNERKSVHFKRKDVNLCISINAAAAAIQMPEATFRTKAQNRSFYFEEALEIRDNLFPELDLRFLFKKDEAS